MKKFISLFRANKIHCISRPFEFIAVKNGYIVEDEYVATKEEVICIALHRFEEIIDSYEVIRYNKNQK